MCAKPECEHSDDSCFAFVLAHDAGIVTIYNRKIYYTQDEYSYEAMYNSVSLREASLDGSQIRTLAVFDRTSYCESFIVTNGGVVLSMRAYDRALEDLEIGSKNLDKARWYVAFVDIGSGEIWRLPEKTDYGNYLHGFAYADGQIYYRYLYLTERGTFNGFTMEMYTEEGKAALASDIGKTRDTIFVADVKEKTERPLCDELTDIRAKDNSSPTGMTYTQDRVYLVQHFQSGQELKADIIGYDLASGQRVQTLLLDYRGCQYMACFEEVFMPYYQMGDEEVTGPQFALNARTGETISIPWMRDYTALGDNQLGRDDIYILYPIAPDKMIIDGQANYLWITSEDFWAGNMDKLHSFARRY